MQGVRKAIPVILAGVVLLAASSAQALINPNFTPIQLVGQSEIILKVMLKAGDKPLTLKAEVVAAIKPKENAPKGPLTIDLTTSPHKAQSEAVAKMAADLPNEFALLFAGSFKEEGEGGGAQMPEGFLNLGGRWVGLFKAKAGGYEMDKIDDHMQGCWAGGTDMLDRAIQYILTDPEPTVPVNSEASWETQKLAGKAPGKVSAAIPVEIGDGLAQYLFVGSDEGDKLFYWDDKEKNLADVTAKFKLTSKSQAAVWGDFNHDGKVDLASWDGKALSVHLQQADGTFQAKPVDVGDSLKAGVVGLSVVDSGKGAAGQAALLVATPGSPVILAPAADGKWMATALGEAPKPPEGSLGKGGVCLAADFDGDGLPDVLQLFAKGGLLYKGKAPGQFDKPAPCQIGLGEGRSKAVLGDYDADGLLDVFVAADDCARLWHNLGGGKFVETLGLSGEIAYISKPGGIDCATCDFNNDGRQDIMIAYGPGQTPQLFFNRGFRSTGHAHAPIDVAEAGLLPEAEKGQQAGCMGDFNGDGAQDMAVVLTNGELWVFYCKVQDEAALSIRLSLPLAGPYAGPLTVVGYNEKRCLGAWNVVAGSQTAFIGQRAAGPRVVKFQLPGGKRQQKEITVLDKPLRYVLDIGK